MAGVTFVCGKPLRWPNFRHTARLCQGRPPHAIRPAVEITAPKAAHIRGYGRQRRRVRRRGAATPHRPPLCTEPNSPNVGEVAYGYDNRGRSRTPGQRPLALPAVLEHPDRASTDQFRCQATALNTITAPRTGMPFIVGTVRCCRMRGHVGDHYGRPRRSLLFSPGRWIAKSWKNTEPG